MCTYGQYEAAKVDEIPAMDKLGEWLGANVPPEGKAAVVHGDFRLDNLIMDSTSENVLAVLDWELSTLGDPLADVAYNCLVYYLPPHFPQLPVTESQ
ncbi:kinase-like domain-containing protein [Baffinella frigidus]|nr:kinase-like domain-containing protein [Cryptophyta sp. CCMP2293]